jgi:Spy/CpxP family protein refolding chaperone
MPRSGAALCLPALTVLVLATTAAPAAGQRPGPGSAPAAEVRDPRLDLLRGITLTARQRARVDSIQAHFDSASARARSKATSAGMEVALAMPLSRERHEAVRAVLTPAQRRTYDRNRAELREWMRREGHH